MRKNRSSSIVPLMCLVGGLCSASSTLAQSDFAGTWFLQSADGAVGDATFCVLNDGSVVVDGAGRLGSNNTVEYAGGTVDENGVFSLTARATNDQTNLRRTRTFTGNLALGGTGSGNGTLVDSSGTNISTTWSALRTSQSNQCTGSGAVPLSLGIASLPKAFVGVAYSVTLEARGGIPPYTFAVTGLPSGLTFEVSSSAISGTADSGTSGSHTLQITLTDDIGTGTTGQLDLVVGVSETGTETNPLTPFFLCGSATPLPWMTIGLVLGLMRFRPSRRPGRHHR